jgi:hypothetical protein
MNVKASAPGAVYLNWQRPKRIELIGCGGTGSRLAELLCRMIRGFALDGVTLRLWDGDVVEPANIARQNFEPCELGQNKAQALALRLSGRFALPVQAAGVEFNRHNLAAAGVEYYQGHGQGRRYGSWSSPAFVTCTDNLSSRRLAAQIYPGWWLDVGNTMTTGQAVIGCTHDGSRLKSARDRYEQGRRAVMTQGVEDGTIQVDLLPDLAAVDVGMMTSRKRGTAGPSCAAMPFAQQGFCVNELAALAAASLLKALMVDGQLTVGAIFFDAASGRMTPRAITREWLAIGAEA